MGPLWSEQGTVPHCTVSDLLSTDMLVSPPGAPVGAGEGNKPNITLQHCSYTFNEGKNSSFVRHTDCSTTKHSCHPHSTKIIRIKCSDIVASGSSIRDWLHAWYCCYTITQSHTGNWDVVTVRSNKLWSCPWHHDGGGCGGECEISRWWNSYG